MRNWKTNTAGIVAILGALSVVLKAVLGEGGVPSEELTAAGAALVTGIGLLFAKDHNVTGDGTKPTEPQP